MTHIFLKNQQGIKFCSEFLLYLYWNLVMNYAVQLKINDIQFQFQNMEF